MGLWLTRCVTECLNTDRASTMKVLTYMPRNIRGCQANTWGLLDRKMSDTVNIDKGPTTALKKKKDDEKKKKTGKQTNKQSIPERTY